MHYTLITKLPKHQADVHVSASLPRGRGSFSELSALTGIPQSTISAIERDRINLGVERAKVLARALQCHPAVLVFPGWDVKRESAASSGGQ